MTYREQRERRIERLQDWATKRDAKSSAAYEAASEFIEQIPLGQPILVGHHSEKRHRREIARFNNNMQASCDSAAKAESMRERASNIQDQLDRSIYNDDPDAIQKLEERIASLEAKREQTKAFNKTCRSGNPDLSLLPEKTREDYLWRLNDNPKLWLGSHNTLGYSNLTQEINRNKKRLVMLKRRQARG